MSFKEYILDCGPHLLLGGYMSLVIAGVSLVVSGRLDDVTWLKVGLAPSTQELVIETCCCCAEP